jgi:hypothetical protein
VSLCVLMRILHTGAALKHKLVGWLRVNSLAQPGTGESFNVEWAEGFNRTSEYPANQSPDTCWCVPAVRPACCCKTCVRSFTYPMHVMRPVCDVLFVTHCLVLCCVVYCPARHA